CGSDPHKLALGLKVRDRARANVEHRLSEPANQLTHHRRERALVWHPALDAFRNEVVVAGSVGLEIAVLRIRHPAARGHRAKRTHAAIALELLAVDEHQ